MTHKVIHPGSISKMLHIIGILTDHIATSQLDTIKSQVPGDYLILKTTKKNKNYMEIGSNEIIVMMCDGLDATKNIDSHNISVA